LNGFNYLGDLTGFNKRWKTTKEKVFKSSGCRSGAL